MGIGTNELISSGLRGYDGMRNLMLYYGAVLIQKGCLAWKNFCMQ